MTAVPGIAATTISTSAFALLSDVRVTGTVGVTVGPVASTSGTSSPGYTATNSQPLLDTTIGLGNVIGVSAGLRLGTNMLTSISTADDILPGHTTTGSGRSQVDNLGVGLFTKEGLLPQLTTLGLTADTLSSKTTVSLLGNSALLTGTSVFTNLNVRLLSLVNFGLGANAQVLPNTVLINALGIKITLNEQIAGRVGNTVQSLTTNAISIVLTDYALGGRLLTGKMVFGNSQSVVNFDRPAAAVPEPAVWLQLIAGFGLTGAVLRRRAANTTDA